MEKGGGSYTQPSLSEDYYRGNSSASPYNRSEAEFEAAILQDQAEIEASRVQYPSEPEVDLEFPSEPGVELEFPREFPRECYSLVHYPPRVQYPPQPEVEFGFPKECYCGATPIIHTSVSRNETGRRYYTCANVDDGDCHIHKWWDVAVMEEMRDMGAQVSQLSDKVDHLASVSNYEAELNEVRDINYETVGKLTELEKIVGGLSGTGNRHGFEPISLCVMVFVVLVIAMVIMFK